MNERNEVLKVIPVRNLSELKYVARVSAYWFVKRLVSRQITLYTRNFQCFWKQRIDEDIAILRKDLSRIDDWFNRRWKNGSAKLKCNLKKKYKIKAKVFKVVIEELNQRISVERTTKKSFMKS